MWVRLLIGAVLSVIFVTAGVIADRVVHAYGDARYAAGRAEARLAEVPAVLAANAATTRAALAARDRIIAAEARAAAVDGRLTAQIIDSEKEVDRYEATAAGNVTCLDAERVRGIEAARTAIFAATGAKDAGDEAGSVPPHKPEQER